MGTSTSGIDEAEKALAFLQETGQMPADYDYTRQEVGACSEFLAQFYGLRGPAYTVSTACSSSGKAFASARGLISSGLCDVVIVGGTDTLCQLTLLGFASLEAVSDELTNPFSINRNGINIGEASAIFMMSGEPVGPMLLGVGESSDAHHMSAPEPSGSGAIACMTAALEEAKLVPEDINYINLHGTATKLNDSMESLAVNKVFGSGVPCSSTKALTGHTLGAAGATEAALCWLLLEGENPHLVAPHVFDGKQDPELAEIFLCTRNRYDSAVRYIMSNSFAFGGNNVSVILGRNTHA
jgi:3-oxoacyl-[acyl-carrier-protein] synthase-1